MSSFQWFFLFFCVFQAVSTGRRAYRDRRLQDTVFCVVWVIAALLLLRPSLSTDLATAMGITRGVDLILYALAFVFLWAHYQHYSRYKQLEDHVTMLVRELALQRAWVDEREASKSDR